MSCSRDTGKSTKISGFQLFVQDVFTINEYFNYSSIEKYQLAKQKWDNDLSKKDRYRYKDKAKKENRRISVVQHPESSNKTSIPVIINETIQMKMKLIEKENFKIVKVKESLRKACNPDALEQTFFYILSIASFFETTSDIFPAELAIAKFSLKLGIIEDFQIKINPGNLPLGSTWTAAERSILKHKYPLPQNNDEDYDEAYNYLLDLEKIVNFLHPLDEVPMFFTKASKYEDHEILQNTERALKKIFNKGGEYQISSNLMVCSVTDLFYFLNKTVAVIKRLDEVEAFEFPSRSNAEETFHTTELTEFNIPGCEFHNEVDAMNHCCLSKVRRYAYTILKYCSNETKYPLIECCHYPQGYKLA